MQASELETAPSRVAQPPRAMVWVLVAASAAAVVATGLVATLLILGNIVAWPPFTPWVFAAHVAGAAAFTLVSLSLRSLRWVYLLRRAETRIPIRDAYIGYFAGFSLLFAPLLAGEIAVRAWVQRARARVPVSTTVVVNVWERLVDLTALGIIAGVASLVTGQATGWTLALFAAALLTLVGPLRRTALAGVLRLAAPVSRFFDDGRVEGFERLAARQTWTVALSASVAAWLLPGIGFWLLAGAWGPSFGFFAAQHAYAASAAFGGLALAPGGVLVVGRQMLASLLAQGFPVPAAALTVFSIRIATAGVSMAMGCVFVYLHVRSSAASGREHFDEIADAYDVQIPEARRLELLTRKTELMREILAPIGAARGLDVGCGQGAYVARMRSIGFDVEGIDQSAEQIRLAARNVGGPGLVHVGSVLEIPAADGSYDFAYTINVLHHLPSVPDQRRAFRELFRVLKPGGVLFVHEINTRNVLFRFYMGYVFPSLNCIDEGVERWLLPHRLAHYTDQPVTAVRYFTFLPEFIPRFLVGALRPIEQRLEHSDYAVYSAHYMAVLRKTT